MIWLILLLFLVFGVGVETISLAGAYKVLRGYEEQPRLSVQQIWKWSAISAFAHVCINVLAGLLAVVAVMGYSAVYNSYDPADLDIGQWVLLVGIGVLYSIARVAWIIWAYDLDGIIQALGLILLCVLIEVLLTSIITLPFSSFFASFDLLHADFPLPDGGRRVSAG